MGYKSDGRISGYSAGLYATWYQNDANKTGAYVDSWALYNWFDNSVTCHHAKMPAILRVATPLRQIAA
ncbi:autotransporter outer membrane beta-barrel domain-containing protein [Escherichia sp. TWPC-MK]